MMRMDQNGRHENPPTKPLKPARVALNVLALCFALSVLGRGLGESFTVFLKPISEEFGWDRAQVVSVYSLTWLAGGLTAPIVGRRRGRCGQLDPQRPELPLRHQHLRRLGLGGVAQARHGHRRAHCRASCGGRVLACQGGEGSARPDFEEGGVEPSQRGAQGS